MMKEFRIGDLFEIINNPQLDRVNFNFDEHAEYPYFTRTENNNGILGYVDYLDDEHKIQGNSLAVGMISMKFHYMAHDFYAGQFTKTLIPKFDEFNEVLALYFIVVLNKHSEQYQGFLVRHFKDKVSETVVSLPVIASSDPNHVYTVDDIDWQYMQDRIAELEQDRIAELEAYLAATGLDDYELTDEDKAVLCDEKVMVKEFTIEQVFTVKKVYGRPQKTYGIGDTAYVTGAKNNNGVVGFVKADDKSISKGNCISVDPITGMSCYQPVDFVGRGFSGASINLLYNDNLNEKTALFVCSVIEKVASSVAAYTNLFNSTRLATAKISLPVIESSDPNHVYTVDDIDLNYMERYIRAMEKLAIADVVKYKDKVIATTKQVVEQQ